MPKPVVLQQLLSRVIFNRWEQTITVDKAGDSDAFKKGDVLDYTPNNEGFTIKAHSEFGDISFTKNK